MITARQQLSRPRPSPPADFSELPSDSYESQFVKWDELSYIRKKPRRATPFDRNLYFYPEGLATLFAHPKVAKSPEQIRRKLLVLHLYNYLEFTVRLELGPVNEISKLLCHEEFLPWLPSQMKDDAFKIYVDEGGHAEMSHILMMAVQESTKVERLRLTPAFLRILDDLVSSEELEYRPLIELFFVIISETLITGSLVKLPKDESVQRAVRDLANDHATDEGRHHAYFRKVFEYVWPRLPREMRRKIGILLPDMILAFLQPDKSALTRMLESFPEEFPKPAQIVEEVVDYKSTHDGIVTSASPTLKMLRENHVFDDPAIDNAFMGLRLVPSRMNARPSMSNWDAEYSNRGLRDYLMGILAVPLTDREVTRVLAGRDNQTRSAAFQDWLINTRQLHSTLSYEVRLHDSRSEWMFLDIEHPIKGSVGFRFVEQSELLTSEVSLPETIQRESLDWKLDLTVCAFCADETQPGVKEAIDACWQSSRNLGNHLMLMEPAWLAGIVVEQIRPILQGETSSDSILTATSFYEGAKGGLPENISVHRVKNRFQAVLGTVTDEPGTFAQRWRKLRKEDIFAGPILLCTTFLPLVTHSSDAVVRFHKSFGATEETCVLIKEKVEWEREVWRKHITQYERYDIVDRGLVEEYFAAPEYYQMPLTIRELQDQVSTLLELLKYDNYNLCLTPEALDISYEIRGHEVRVRTDRRNKGQPRLGRISGVILSELQMADVFEREFWSIYRLSETEFKNKKHVASWLKSLAEKYKATGLSRNPELQIGDGSI